MKNRTGAVRTGSLVFVSPTDPANVKFLKEAGMLKIDIPWTAVVTNEYLPK